MGAPATRAFAAAGPVSVEAIADGLAGRLPRADLASTYRNLETLERIGLVRHVHLGHGPGRYALVGSPEREYVACERCDAFVALSAGVAVKATIGTTAAVLLGSTTPFPDLLRGLVALRVPRLPTLIAAVTYRYLWVVADDVRRMRIALSARAYRPRTLLRCGTIGRLVAALFLRTHARGERVHLAMLARGYDGTMPAAAPLRLGRADAAFVALVLGLALGARAAALSA